MNVCLVSREFPPFVGGGIGSYTRRLATELARRGHAVVVVTVSDDGLDHREEIDGFVVERLAFIRGSDWSRPDPSVDTPAVRAAFEGLHPICALSLIIRERLPRLIDEFGFDVIEFPDTGALGWFTLNARRNGLMRTPPVVVTVHSPTSWVNELNHDPGTDRGSLALELMEADCVRWADGLCCPSRALARRVESDLGLAAGAIEAIPLPLGELEDESERRPSPPRPRRLFFAGRLEPRKGVEVLLAGFERAIEAGADMHLDLCGADAIDVRVGGWFGKRALRRLGEKARRRVTVHGRLDPGRLGALRGAASLAVVASPDDNFPYTCVEAMASGLGVLATNAGGMSEMVRDGVDGRLVAHTPEAWGAAIRWAAEADDKTLDEMGRHARERIVEMCGNETIVAARVARYSAVGVREATEKPADVVFINAGAIGDEARRLLSEAAAQIGGFAIGWRRTQSGGFIACPTPTAEWLCLEDGCDGPLCVTRDALASAGASAHADACDDVPGLMLTLLQAGVPGATTPEAIVEGASERTALGFDGRLTGAGLERVSRLMLARAAERRATAATAGPGAGQTLVLGSLGRIVRAIRRRVRPRTSSG
jgi:glycosyltransferase involved in cell wall biosynthesis